MKIIHSCNKSWLMLLNVAIVVFFVNCVAEFPVNKPTSSTQAYKVDCDTNKTTTTSSRFYFPPEIFSNQKDLNQYKTDAYTNFLKAMNEISLYEMKKTIGVEVYRFLELPAFSPPIMISIQKCDTNYMLTAKELTSNKIENPGIIKKQKKKKLSEQEWQRCMIYFEKVHFWSLPTTQESNINDATQWVLEGVKDGKYHVIDRQSPSTEFEKCYSYLVEISGLTDSTTETSEKK